MAIGSYVLGTPVGQAGQSVANLYHGMTSGSYQGENLWDWASNTPLHQSHEYQRAGINPNLASLSAGASTGGLIGSGAAAAGAAQSAASSIASGIGAYQAMRTTNATIEQTKANARKTSLEADGQEYINTSLKNAAEISGSEVTKAGEEAKQSQLETNIKNSEMELKGIELDIQRELKSNTIKLGKMEREALQKQIKYVQSQITNLKYLNGKIKAETDLTRKRKLEVDLRTKAQALANQQTAWQNKYTRESAVSPTFKKYTQYLHDAISSVSSSWRTFR